MHRKFLNHFQQVFFRLLFFNFFLVQFLIFFIGNQSRTFIIRMLIFMWFPHMRNTCVVSYFCNPCRKFRVAPEMFQFPVDLNKHILTNIFSIFPALHNTANNMCHQPLVFYHQKPECIAVPVDNLLYKIFVIHSCNI